jgi:uncharacterized repeat protein (TIGR03943 family)
MKHLRTSTVIAALCATVLLRLASTDQYARYVQTGMRIPLLIAGVVLGAMAVVQLSGLASGEDTHPEVQAHVEAHEHSPAVLWLLIIPVLAVLVVAPPPLGGWGLDRQQNQRSAGLSWSPLTISAGQPTAIPLPDFVGRALEKDSPTVAGVKVELVGFVGERRDTSFVLARYSIACCAADAMASQVDVSGGTLPPLPLNSTKLQWVRVVGTLTGVAGAVPQLEATEVTGIDEPSDPYV